MRAFAAVWGFAEATLFFLVPDIVLSFIALRQGSRQAGIAALIVAVAAAAGGATMWLLARADGPALLALLDSVPAISATMIADIGQSIRQPDWIWQMLAGAVTGVPYKIFAAQAGIAGVALPAFVLASVPVRLARFVGVIVLVALYRRFAVPRLGAQRALWLLVLFWAAFYAAFWLLMPS